jgi:hypothetical protein
MFEGRDGLVWQVGTPPGYVLVHANCPHGLAGAVALGVVRKQDDSIHERTEHGSRDRAARGWIVRASGNGRAQRPGGADHHRDGDGLGGGHRDRGTSTDRVRFGGGRLRQPLSALSGGTDLLEPEPGRVPLTTYLS